VLDVTEIPPEKLDSMDSMVDPGLLEAVQSKLTQYLAVGLSKS